MTGRLGQRTYELKDGSSKRTVLEVEADDVAASLKFASAKITKAARSKPTAGNGHTDADPWASEGPGGYSDETPF